VEDDFYFFFISNMSMLTEHTKVAPYAHLTDGYFDLLFTKQLNSAKAAKLLLSLDEQGSIASMKEVEYYKVRTVTLEPKNLVGNIMVDGEKLPEVSNLKITALPCMIKLYVPQAI